MKKKIKKEGMEETDLEILSKKKQTKTERIQKNSVKQKISS